MSDELEGLSEDQLDGLACRFCGRPLFEGAPVLTTAAGVGPRGSLLRCWPACERAPRLRVVEAHHGTR